VGHVGATANGQMNPLAVRRGASASLLFANADERPRRVSLRELADLGSTADLVVLSGCSTPVAALEPGSYLRHWRAADPRL